MSNQETDPLLRLHTRPSTSSIRMSTGGILLSPSSTSDDRRRTWSPLAITDHVPRLYWPSTDRHYDHEDVSFHGQRWFYSNYTTIDWIHDYVKDRIRQRDLNSKTDFNSKLRKYADGIQAWFVLFGVGTSCGAIASFLDVNILFLEDLKVGFCPQIFKPQSHCSNWRNWRDILGDAEWIVYAGLTVIYALCSYLIVSIGPYSSVSLDPHRISPAMYHASGSGVPQVKTILGGFVIRGYLGIRTLVTKFFALIFSISSGLMVGVQGPLVHISCAVGNVLSRVFYKYKKNEAKRREILSAACAAGVSVAFGAPIGGVLFSLEEVSYYFPMKTMWRSFFCALVAAVTIKIINPLGTGKLVMFQVSYDRDWHIFELVPFLFLGIFGGLYGAFFIKSLTWMNDFKTRFGLEKYPTAQIVAIAGITGILSYLNEFTSVSKTTLVANLFKECASHDTSTLCTANYLQLLSMLFFALLINGFLMVITFGIRVPGGIFIPCMVIGALMGRIAGILMEHLYLNFPDLVFWRHCGDKCIIPGVYALVGAAATLSGATRMTVSLSVIMFELTGALTYVLPLMMSIMIAKWVGDAFGKDSVYDKIIMQEGYPYMDHKRTLIPTAATAANIMTDDSTLEINVVYTLSELESYLAQLSIIYPAKDGGFPLVNNQILVGYLAQSDLEHALEVARYNYDHVVFNSKLESEDTIDLWQWVDKAPMTVSSSTSAEMVLELFLKLGIRTLLVVDSGEFSGVIHKKRMLKFLQKAIIP